LDSELKKIAKTEVISLLFLVTGKYSFNNFGVSRPNQLALKVNEIKKEEIEIDHLIELFNSFKSKKGNNEGINFIIDNLRAREI